MDGDVDVDADLDVGEEVEDEKEMDESMSADVLSGAATPREETNALENTVKMEIDPSQLILFPTPSGKLWSNILRIGCSYS